MLKESGEKSLGSNVFIGNGMVNLAGLWQLSDSIDGRDWTHEVHVMSVFLYRFVLLGQ